MMKKNIFGIILIAFSIGLIGSCKKPLQLVDPVLYTNGLAYLKIGDFSPSFRQIVNGADSFNIYINGNKVNGGFLSFGSLYPTITNPYFGVPEGFQTIRITVNGVTTPDSITLASFSKTLVAGSSYSFFLTDSMLKPNEAKQIFLQDNFALTDTTHFSVRFIHAILNDTLGKNVDIYSTRLAANLYSSISPGTSTSFSVQNYTLPSDTLIVRRQGTLLELARLNGVVFNRQRPYTLLYKGQPATTTGTKARSLISFANQ